MKRNLLIVLASLMAFFGGLFYFSGFAMLEISQSIFKNHEKKAER